MDLLKPIHRIARHIEIANKDERDIIVTLYPHGVIGLREKKRRKEVTITLAAIWSMAWKIEAEQQQKQRATDRAARKAKK